MTYVRDWKKIDDMLTAGCCGAEIAGYLGVNQDTLYRWTREDKKMPFTEYMAEKKSKGDSILRAHQYAKALGLTDKGDNTLLIWLGKCRLRQKDASEPTPAHTESLEKLFANLPTMARIAELEAELDEFKRKANQEHHGVEQAPEHLGGCSSVGENICEHPEANPAD